MKPRQKSDDGLRALIRRHLPTIQGSLIHWVSIESPGTASGIHDLYGRWRGLAFWIECKATDGWALSTLTEFQVRFALREARAGGTTFLATRRRVLGGPRTPPADELYLNRGIDTPLLRSTVSRGRGSGGLRAAPPLLVTPGGPGGWDWEEFGRLLVT